MTDDATWRKYGASASCAYALPLMEGEGVTSKNYNGSGVPGPIVDGWFSDAAGPFTSMYEANVFPPPLTPIPVGGWWGNNESPPFTRGISTASVYCTGPIGTESRDPYVNVELGAVITGHQFFDSFATLDNGGVGPLNLKLRFQNLPGYNAVTGVYDPDIQLVIGRRYVVGVFMGYSDTEDSYETGQHFQYEVREYTGAVETASWSGTALLPRNQVSLCTSGGWPDVFPNTNVFPEGGGDPYQLMSGYIVFWMGRRESIDDLAAAVDFLAPNWVTGNMEIWQPWADMNPLLSDYSPPTLNDARLAVVGGVNTNDGLYAYFKGE